MLGHQRKYMFELLSTTDGRTVGCNSSPSTLHKEWFLLCWPLSASTTYVLRAVFCYSVLYYYIYPLLTQILHTIGSIRHTKNLCWMLLVTYYKVVQCITNTLNGGKKGFFQCGCCFCFRKIINMPLNGSLNRLGGGVKLVLNTNWNNYSATTQSRLMITVYPLPIRPLYIFWIHFKSFSRENAVESRMMTFIACNPWVCWAVWSKIF